MLETSAVLRSVAKECYSVLEKNSGEDCCGEVCVREDCCKQGLTESVVEKCCKRVVSAVAAP